MKKMLIAGMVVSLFSMVGRGVFALGKYDNLKSTNNGNMLTAKMRDDLVDALGLLFQRLESINCPVTPPTPPTPPTPDPKYKNVCEYDEALDTQDPKNNGWRESESGTYTCINLTTPVACYYTKRQGGALSYFPEGSEKCSSTARTEKKAGPDDGFYEWGFVDNFGAGLAFKAYTKEFCSGNNCNKWYKRDSNKYPTEEKLYKECGPTNSPETNKNYVKAKPVEGKFIDIACKMLNYAVGNADPYNYWDFMDRKKFYCSKHGHKGCKVVKKCIKNCPTP